VITTTKLKMHTVKDLAEMARKKGVSGWHSMRKDQLIKALLKHAKSDGPSLAKRAKTNGNGKAATAVLVHGNGSNGEAARKAKTTRIRNRLRQIKERLSQFKDLAFRNGLNGDGPVRDRLVVMVRDPYWLHAYWELHRASIERAKVAMGQHWHGARPVLRVHEITADGTATSARRMVRQIDVHGGVNTWYIDVQDPPKTYQMDIGYQSPCGKFYALARSNVVHTPAVSPGEAFDRNWADVAKDCDRIYALSGGYSSENGANGHGELREILEEHSERPMGPPLSSRLGVAAIGPHHEFQFDVDAELVVFGAADPNSHVTLRGEPVRLQPDGSFMVRFSLPDRRQVLPIVASSADGAEQRTIVLAVERNTKVMEPVTRESSD
jgi:hypothetical protein